MKHGPPQKPCVAVIDAYPVKTKTQHGDGASQSGSPRLGGIGFGTRWAFTYSAAPGRLLPDDDGVALVAARVDVADGDGPPLASEFATPPFPAAASPPFRWSPPVPPAAALPSPPSAVETAVPPSALMSMVVSFVTVPPSTATLPPEVFPTTMVLPTLPPELMSPRVTAPPLAWATATRRCRPLHRPRSRWPTGAPGRGVVVATVGTGDRRAAVGADREGGAVGDGAAIDMDVRGGPEQTTADPTRTVLPRLLPELMFRRPRSLRRWPAPRPAHHCRGGVPPCRGVRRGRRGGIAVATVRAADGDAAIRAQVQGRRIATVPPLTDTVLGPCGTGRSRH